MTAQFIGFDHVDTRVRSLKAVEKFYDALMPELGLSRKSRAYVDEQGDWGDGTDERYNAVEYHEPEVAGRAALFIGFIEDPAMLPSFTRIAFRIASRGELDRWRTLLTSIGAVRIEDSASEEYPAIFFEDPAGTKLEVCARLPSPSRDE